WDNKFKVNRFIQDYGPGLEWLYNHLNHSGKELLIDLIAFRLLGYKKVKLPVNNSFYHDSLQTVKGLKVSGGEKIPTGFMHFVLERFSLRKIGYDISFFYHDVGILIDFMLEQYGYRENNEYIVQ